MKPCTYTTRIPIFSNKPSWLDGFFLLETKGLNDNEYFFTNQFDQSGRFDN